MTSHREFQHLQTLRRFGLDVADKLSEGSVAVLCPACPHSSINMDPDWETRPQTEWYKDALFFAKDGNFVLSQHDKKLDPKDVSLFDGAAYFPDNAEYQDFLKGSKDDADLDCEVHILAFFNAPISHLSDTRRRKHVANSRQARHATQERLYPG